MRLGHFPPSQRCVDGAQQILASHPVARVQRRNVPRIRAQQGTALGGPPGVNPAQSVLTERPLRFPVQKAASPVRGSGGRRYLDTLDFQRRQRARHIIPGQFPLAQGQQIGESETFHPFLSQGQYASEVFPVQHGTAKTAAGSAAPASSPRSGTRTAFHFDFSGSAHNSPSDTTSTTTMRRTEQASFCPSAGWSLFVSP